MTEGGRLGREESADDVDDLARSVTFPGARETGQGGDAEQAWMRTRVLITPAFMPCVPVVSLRRGRHPARTGAEHVGAGCERDPAAQTAVRSPGTSPNHRET